MQSDEKHVVVIALTGTDRTTWVRIHERNVTLRHLSCEGDTDRARALIRQHDGSAAAIALDGLPGTCAWRIPIFFGNSPHIIDL